MLGDEPDTRLGIVTMKSRRGLNRVVDAYGIREYFATLKSADDGPQTGTGLVAGCHGRMRRDGRANCHDRRYKFRHDYGESRHAYAIGVGWGYQSVEEVVEAGADAVAEQPEKLVELLENLPADG